MSFRCGACHKSQGSREKPIKVVTQIRRVTYPQMKDGRIPEGFEIVREVDMCKRCANKYD